MSSNTDGITLTVLKTVNDPSNIFVETFALDPSSSPTLSGIEPLNESSELSSELSVSPNSSDVFQGENYVPAPVTSLPVKNNLLKNLLGGDSEGQAILEYFSKHSELTDALRSLLCRRILILCLAQSPSKTISTKQIEVIAKAIETLFYPKEISETYYLPAVKENGKVIGASGKLYYTYTYLRRKLVAQEKAVKKSLTANENVANDDSLMIEISEIEECLNWLKTNIGDDEKVKNYWEKTRTRRKQILSEGNSIFSYIHTFPCLRTSIAKTLFQTDFASQYPSINYEENWNNVKPKLIGLLKKEIKPATSDLICKLIDLDARGEDADAILFLLLPYLFKRGPLKRDVHGKIKQRCSLAETQDAFILHIENSCDLNASINKRREELKKKKLQLQPTPVFVGRLETAITSAYVILDTEKYCFQSPRAAVNFAFVLFFALGAKYPEEAKLVWQLIQVVVYGIRVKSSDLRSVEFSTLVGKLT